jgi:3-deoxy-D-manno-octulosonic-acid transferase
MLRLVYRALWWLIAPAAVLRLLIRSRRERGYREHIGERFGFGYEDGAARRADNLAPLVWVRRMRASGCARRNR